ncbi:MAG: FAD-dependent oxidoreductase [Deltaproteobacteria bacterium]|nr:FAD-dependent oxidoreductase [Deltaproteobacteria bacterium]
MMRASCLVLVALGIAACPPPPTTTTTTPLPAPPVPAPAALKGAPIAASAAAPERTTVAIVGGGLAGLVTAHELKKAGIAFHLFEKEDVVGGRVQTAHYDGGLHAEYGLQELWGDNPLLPIVKELGVPIDGDVEETYSSMVLDDKLYGFTQDTNDEYFASMMKPEEVKQLKDWMVKARALRAVAEKEGLKSPEILKLQGMSFAKWVQTFNLPKRVNDWIRLTIECELATSWEVFSGLVGLLEFGVFLGEGEPNYKILGGNFKLIEALANEAAPSVTTSALVSRVDRRKDKDGKSTVFVSYMKEGHEKTMQADRVVVAVPPWRLHQIHFDPPLSAQKTEAISTLMRGSYTVVHMIVNKDYHQLTDKPGQASVFPVLTDGVLGVIYGAQSEAPKESKNEVFAFLVHGNPAYAFHMQPRDVKIKEMLAAMDKLWPGFSKLVVTTYVYTYHPGAITVWPAGRSPLDDKTRSLRTPEDGLSLAGDYLWSGHSDGAGRSAIDAAAAIVTALKKP